MSRTQCDRILALSKRFNGVCQSDLLGPDVADDGPPITRVAARLWDLEQEGHAFEHIGWRSKTKVFRLIEAERSAGDDQHDGKSEASRKGTAVLTAGCPSDASAPLSPEVVEVEQEKPNTTKPLFKSVGKAQFGYADQGELDAA